MSVLCLFLFLVLGFASSLLVRFRREWTLCNRLLPPTAARTSGAVARHNQVFLKSAMSVLERTFDSNQDEVLSIIKDLQVAGGCRDRRGRRSWCCPAVAYVPMLVPPVRPVSLPLFSRHFLPSLLLLSLYAASDPSDADPLRPRQGRRRRLHVQGGPGGQEAPRRFHLQVRFGKSERKA